MQSGVWTPLGWCAAADSAAAVELVAARAAARCDPRMIMLRNGHSAMTCHRGSWALSVLDKWNAEWVVMQAPRPG